jgi:hypothetical protein
MRRIVSAVVVLGALAFVLAAVDAALPHVMVWRSDGMLQYFLDESETAPSPYMARLRIRAMTLLLERSARHVNPVWRTHATGYWMECVEDYRRNTGCEDRSISRRLAAIKLSLFSDETPLDPLLCEHWPADAPRATKDRWRICDQAFHGGWYFENEKLEQRERTLTVARAKAGAALAP